MTSDLLGLFAYGSLRMKGDNQRESILRSGVVVETNGSAVAGEMEDECNRRNSTRPRSLNPARRRGRRDSGFATVQGASGEDDGPARQGHCSLVD
jgi:hypothetical protein